MGQAAAPTACSKVGCSIGQPFLVTPDFRRTLRLPLPHTLATWLLGQAHQTTLLSFLTPPPSQQLQMEQQQPSHSNAEVPLVTLTTLLRSPQQHRTGVLPTQSSDENCWEMLVWYWSRAAGELASEACSTPAGRAAGGCPTALSCWLPFPRHTHTWLTVWHRVRGAVTGCIGLGALEGADRFCQRSWEGASQAGLNLGRKLSLGRGQQSEDSEPWSLSNAGACTSETGFAETK